jgi:hypothetical protein
LALDRCFGIQGRRIHARMSTWLTKLPEPEAGKRLPTLLAALAPVTGWIPPDMRNGPRGLPA